MAKAVEITDTSADDLRTRPHLAGRPVLEAIDLESDTTAIVDGIEPPSEDGSESDNVSDDDLDDGIRLRSKGRGYFAHFIGRKQVKEYGYIHITDFTEREVNEYEKRSEKQCRLKATSRRAMDDRGISG